MSNTARDGTFAFGDGGGIWNGGTIVISGSQVAGNVAAGSGGGIYNEQADGGTVTLDASSSVSSNDPDDCYGTAAC